jgi:hypothetical protein
MATVATRASRTSWKQNDVLDGWKMMQFPELG